MEKITALTALTGSIVGVATLANAVWQYRRKVHLEIFRIYADRYNAILTPDLYLKWQAALNGEQDCWSELTPTMIQYLNLIWEECFLSKTGKRGRFVVFFIVTCLSARILRRNIKSHRLGNIRSSSSPCLRGQHGLRFSFLDHRSRLNGASLVSGFLCRKR